MAPRAVRGRLGVELDLAPDEGVRLEDAADEVAVGDRGLLYRRARSRPGQETAPALCGPTRSAPAGSIHAIEPPPWPTELISTIGRTE